MSEITILPLHQITPGNNDRKAFARQPLLELAQSIAAQGLAQPITVRPLNGGNQSALFNDLAFEIVAGERRYRAHQLYTEMVQSGQWPESKLVRPGTIQAIVRPLTDEQAAAVMLVENTGRQDLNPKEQAQAFAARCDIYDWSTARIAQVAGVSEETVKARLALLTLADDILNQVGNGQIPLAYAGQMTDLDHNRQRLAVRLLSAGPVSLPNFRRYVLQLKEEQEQDTLFDLTNFWVAQVEDLAGGPLNGKEALARLDLPDCPGLPDCAPRYGTPTGDILFRYIQTLLGDGLASEAAAVGRVYAALVAIRKASLPKLCPVAESD